MIAYDSLCCLVTYSPKLNMVTYIQHMIPMANYIGGGNLSAYEAYLSLSDLHRF
jgi:hypothetical protein